MAHVKAGRQRTAYEISAAVTNGRLSRAALFVSAVRLATAALPSCTKTALVLAALPATDLRSSVVESKGKPTRFHDRPWLDVQSQCGGECGDEPGAVDVRPSTSSA